jgi:anti-sigma B factor antagonist
MSLAIRIIKKENFVYVIALKGSLDTETYSGLEDKLSEIINDTTKAIIFDMTDLDYISSIGIKVVIATKKSLESKNANFAMINLQPQINKIFDMMKILPMFDIFDDMPEADKYIDQVIHEELAKEAKK